MRRPETAKLNISQSDWLLVKKHLTAGEQRAVFARMIRYGGDGASLDPILVGHSKVVGYLLDWSIQDADGKPVAIQGRPESVIAAALDALDSDSFAEILKAVEAHEKAMEQEREQEKNAQAGGIASSPISPSAAG